MKSTDNLSCTRHKMLLTTLSLLLLSVVGVLSHSSPLLSEQDASAVYPPLIENIRGTYLYGYEYVSTPCDHFSRLILGQWM